MEELERPFRRSLSRREVFNVSEAAARRGNRSSAAATKTISEGVRHGLLSRHSTRAWRHRDWRNIVYARAAAHGGRDRRAFSATFLRNG